MTKKWLSGLITALAVFVLSSGAEVVSNFFSDAGFETPDGSFPAYEPNAVTTPWFTIGENADGSFKATTNTANGGSQSVVFDWYGDSGAIVQDLAAQVDAGIVYEASIWMLTAEPSANGAHVNPPTLNIGLYTSTNSGASYQFAQTLYAGAQNSTTNLWEQFVVLIDGASLAPYAGQDMQIRFNKPNVNTTHKIYIDDATFGEKLAEPPPPNQLADSGFEAISGNQPNDNTAPWLTIGEGQPGSFVTGTDKAHGGSQSAKFTFYFDDGSIVQNLTNRIDAATDYAASVWLLTDEASTSGSHTNAPSLAIEMYSSPTLGSGYTRAGTFAAGSLNSTTDVWEQFGGILTGGALAGRNGEYIQLRLTKENDNTTHRMWIDDAELIEYAHVPTTYYLNATGGNDTNSGLSTATAWQTLDRLNSEVFGAGDQILFKRGETFTGRFALAGGGTPSAPLVIGAYGPGNKPVLEGGPDDEEVIYSENSRGFEIRNLKIRNFHPSGSYSNRFGVVLNPSVNAGDLEHIHFVNVDFVDIKGAGDSDPDKDHESRGIQADTPNNDFPVVLSRWNDFLIEDCHFENIDGRGAQVRDSCRDIADKIIRGYDYYPSINVVFQNNSGKNCYRNLFQLNGTKGALIQYNTMDGTSEGSAFWPFATDGTVVQFNVFKNILKAGADASACHFDFNCVDTLMQYNVGINVQGSLIQVLNNSNGTNFQINAVARYNLGIDCGWRNSDNSAGIMITGDATGSKIYNNTIITTGLHPNYKALSFANWGGAWPTNSYIANNLFFAAGSPSTYANESKMSIRDNVVTHNMYTGNVAVCSADISPVTGNPRFANASGTNATDFMVTYGSDAVAAGIVIAGNGGRDFFDNTLTNTAPTIGFHEYQTDLAIDTDGDDMPDYWESAYGLAPDNAADAVLDGDNDERDNLNEYIANTVPTNGLSYFVANLLAASGELDWDQRPERYYNVFERADLLSGSWIRVQSNAVPPVAIDFPFNSRGFLKVEVGLPVP